MPDDMHHLPYDLEAGDEVPSNASANPTFTEIATARLGRRGMLMGGLATALTGFIGAGTSPAAAQGAAAGAPAVSTGPVIGFKPVPVNATDAVVVPEGYSVQVIIPQGTPLDGSAGKPLAQMSGAEQGAAVGAHHDGMHFFPIEGREPDQGSSTDGLLVLNHEYVEPRFMHARAGRPVGATAAACRWWTASARRRRGAEGGQRPRRLASFASRSRRDGRWAVVARPAQPPHHRRSRRWRSAGPVARPRAAAGPSTARTARATRGTLNNCAHGVTPWNTYLTCEENWAGYFVNLDAARRQPNLPREHDRYGVPTDAGRATAGTWPRAAPDEFVRFDASRQGRHGRPRTTATSRTASAGWSRSTRSTRRRVAGEAHRARPLRP